MAKFLDKELNEEQIATLANHLKIENFRNNPSVNRQDSRDCGHFSNASEQKFVRNGVSSIGWQKDYTSQMIKRIESWIAKNLADTTLRFPQYS